MPGIAGVVTAEPGVLSSPDDIVRTLEQVQALRGVSFQQRTLRLPRCVILNTFTGILKSNLPQPVSDPRGRAHLLLEGEVFNTDELLPLVQDPIGAQPCEVLLSLYLEKGPEFVALLDGQFNLVIYEPEEGQLTIFSDRFASKAFYYLAENGRLLFASERKCILALSKNSPVLDPLGVLQFFVHRHQVSGRTYIDGLRRLPARSWLVHREGRTSLHTYERPRFVPFDRLPPVGELAEAWGECLRSALARQVRGKDRILISLSGGLDSRAVACAIPRDCRPIVARTRGAASSLEVMYAAEVARRLGFEHFHEDPDVVPYSEILPRVVWRTEGEIPFINCLTVGDHERMKARGDVIFGGQLGDVVSGGHVYPYMLLPGGRQTFLDRVFDHYALYKEKALRAVFNEDFLHDAFTSVTGIFKASFEFAEGESNVDGYQIWDLTERQPRTILSAGSMDSHLFEKVYALLGRDYIDFALRLPLRYRLGQALYQMMIRRIGPEVKDVPNANTNLCLRSTLLGNRLNNLRVLSRKASGRILRKMGLRRPVRQVAARENLATAIRADAAFRSCIESFARSPDLDPDIFNGPGILGLVEEHYSGAADRAHLLCLIATMAVSIRYFVQRRAVSCPEEAEPLAPLRRQPPAIS